jgi:hypothetical protein
MVKMPQSNRQTTLTGFDFCKFQRKIPRSKRVHNSAGPMFRFICLKTPLAFIWNSKWRKLHPAQDVKEHSPLYCRNDTAKKKLRKKYGRNLGCLNLKDGAHRPPGLFSKKTDRVGMNPQCS